MARKPEKISLRRAVEEATDIIEKHLSKLPEEEQESRVAAIARRSFKGGRVGNTKASQAGRTRVSRASNPRR